MSPDTGHLLGAIVSLRVDSMVGEVADAFDAAGVGWILLKGPAIRLRLYDDEGRDYRDLDLLLDRADELPAYSALRSIGLTPREGFGKPEVIALHHEWERGLDLVEVHVTIAGIDAPPARVWATLSEHRRQLDVGGKNVWVFDDAALALHLALHAARHGQAFTKSIRDLERGLSALPHEAWVEASRLARVLDAEPAFAAAMRLMPPELTANVPITGAPTAEALLRSQSANSIAIGLARLDDDVGAGARARHLLRLLCPSRQFLRRWSSQGGRQPLPYPLAYLWRLAYLLWFAVPGVIYWLRAVRAARIERARRPQTP
ncbi:MAG: nucleotidyltransferase family protein [Actinomycetota bacterium]|nr:nucleotidyltransferase family protein [Actinomycetota bacterium]